MGIASPLASHFSKFILVCLGTARIPVRLFPLTCNLWKLMLKMPVSGSLVTHNPAVIYGPTSLVPQVWTGRLVKSTSSPCKMTSFTGPVSTSSTGIRFLNLSATSGNNFSRVVLKANAPCLKLAGAIPKERQPGCPSKFSKNKDFSLDCHNKAPISSLGFTGFLTVKIWSSSSSFLIQSLMSNGI